MIRIGLAIGMLGLSALAALAACPKGMKELAGACVASCPAGYEDRGTTCVYRSIGSGSTGGG